MKENIIKENLDKFIIDEEKGFITKVVKYDKNPQNTENEGIYFLNEIDFYPVKTYTKTFGILIREVEKAKKKYDELEKEKQFNEASEKEKRKIISKQNKEREEEGEKEKEHEKEEKKDKEEKEEKEETEEEKEKEHEIEEEHENEKEHEKEEEGEKEKEEEKEEKKGGGGKDESDSLPVYAIVLIVIGGVAVLIVAGIFIYKFVISKKQLSSQSIGPLSQGNNSGADVELTEKN